MLAQELIERFIVETERRAVDPHEVRALQGPEKMLNAAMQRFKDAYDEAKNA